MSRSEGTGRQATFEGINHEWYRKAGLKDSAILIPNDQCHGDFASAVLSPDQKRIGTITTDGYFSSWDCGVGPVVPFSTVDPLPQEASLQVYLSALLMVCTQFCTWPLTT